MNADISNRQPCCAAPRPDHWEDCPVWRYNRGGGYWYRLDSRRPDDVNRRISYDAQ
jgi:hypothetical protein